MWLFNLLFSSLSQLWYVEVRISRSVSVSPLEFEITRVDCILFIRHDLIFNAFTKLLEKPGRRGETFPIDMIRMCGWNFHDSTYMIVNGDN